MKLIFYDEKGHHLYSFYLIGLISLCKTKLTKKCIHCKNNRHISNLQYKSYEMTHPLILVILFYFQTIYLDLNFDILGFIIYARGDPKYTGHCKTND